MTPEEKVELVELFEYRKRSAFDIRRDRLIAAETRLGMREGGHFGGKGLPEIIERARKGKSLRYDEFIVANFGTLPGERRSDKS